MSVDYESRFPQHTRKTSAAFQYNTLSGGLEARSTLYPKQPVAFRTASKFSADANLFFTPPQPSSVPQTQPLRDNVLSTTNNPPRSDFDGVRCCLADVLPNVSKSEHFVHDTFEMLKAEILRILERNKADILQKLSGFHQPVVQEIERRLKLVDSLQSWAWESTDSNEALSIRRSIYQDQNDNNLLSIAQQIGKFDDMERKSNNKKELLKQISGELGRLQTDAAFIEIKKVSGQSCPYLNKGEIQAATKEILSRLEQNASQFLGDHKVFSDHTYVPLDVKSLKSENMPINVRSELEQKRFDDDGNRIPTTGTLAQIAFSLEDCSVPAQQTAATPILNPKFAKPRGLNQNLSAMVLSNLSTLKAAPVQAGNRLSAVQLYCSRQNPQPRHGTLPVTSTANIEALKPHLSSVLHTPDHTRTLAIRNPIRQPQQPQSISHATDDRGYDQSHQDGQHAKALSLPTLSSTNLSVIALSSFSGLDACLDKSPPTCVTSLAGRPGWLAIGTANGKVLLTDLGVQRVLSFDTEQPVTLLWYKSYKRVFPDAWCIYSIAHAHTNRMQYISKDNNKALLDGSRPHWLLVLQADGSVSLQPLCTPGVCSSTPHTGRHPDARPVVWSVSTLGGRPVVRDVVWDHSLHVWVAACSDGCVRVVAEGFWQKDRVFGVAPGKCVCV